MSITTTQFQRLPDCFQQKIKLDKAVARLKLNKVIPFERGRHLILTQETYRLRCIALLKRQRGQGNAA